ncbi:MAG TPA: twin-arginine translocase TatA/TatE family subunit [bacterium]|nr:twin-arginine translocase TatA/TatE family subunit [bacterium]
MSLGFGEILLILAVVLLLFGAKKLPELARSMGKAMSEFKKGVKEAKEDLEDGEERGRGKKK